jgi:hypothetical protein
MAQKKRSSSKKRPTGEQKSATVDEITRALNALPLPARAIVNEHIKDLDTFRRRYPGLYEVMFKNIGDSKRYREFERDLERAQERRR